MVETTMTHSSIRGPHCQATTVVKTCRTVTILGCLVDHLTKGGWLTGHTDTITRTVMWSHLVKRRMDVVSKLNLRHSCVPMYCEANPKAKNALLTQWSVKHPWFTWTFESLKKKNKQCPLITIYHTWPEGQQSIEKLLRMQHPLRTPLSGGEGGIRLAWIVGSKHTSCGILLQSNIQCTSDSFHKVHFLNFACQIVITIHHL